MFDLSLPKLLVLAVIALVVFGPNELPKMAAKAGKALRELRRIAEGAKADLREGLGPEFADFDIDDLNPRHFVQKHLLSDLNGEMNGHDGSEAGRPGHLPAQGQRPPARRRTPLRHRSDLMLARGDDPPEPPLRFAPRGGTSPAHRPLAGPEGSAMSGVFRCGSAGWLQSSFRVSRPWPGRVGRSASGEAVRRGQPS